MSISLGGHCCGNSSPNSVRHHSRFSIVSITLQPGRSNAGSEIIEKAKGILESHPSDDCNSSQEIDCFEPFNSQLNEAGASPTDPIIPIRPCQIPLRISSCP